MYLDESAAIYSGGLTAAIFYSCYNALEVYLNYSTVHNNISKHFPMQRLFYVVCRWLEEDQSKQADRLGSMIKADMESIGFRYEEISTNERQREELYR